jgi:hypothetical protein
LEELHTQTHTHITLVLFYSVDINGDEIEDLLIASPYRTSKSESVVGETGALFVFLGGKNFPK